MVSFSDTDYEGIRLGHNHSIVLTLDIADRNIWKMLIENKFLVDVLFAHALNRMQLGDHKPEPPEEGTMYNVEHIIILIQEGIYLLVTFENPPPASLPHHQIPHHQYPISLQHDSLNTGTRKITSHNLENPSKG